MYKSEIYTIKIPVEFFFLNRLNKKQVTMNYKLKIKIYKQNLSYSILPPTGELEKLPTLFTNRLPLMLDVYKAKLPGARGSIGSTVSQYVALQRHTKFSGPNDNFEHGRP